MTRADEIFDSVYEAMQSAEEMGGPEGQDYVNLMKRISAEAVMRIKNYYSWRIPTIDVTVTKMKAEILADMENKIVHPEVGSFSGLHDYVDANCYGGFCDDDLNSALIDFFDEGDWSEGMPQGMLDYINECQGQIDLWLKSGKN